MVCRGVLVGDVARAPPLVENALDRGLDPAGLLGHVEGVREHHAHGEDLGQRVSNALAGDVGRGAGGRLEQRDAIAQGCGCQHAER